MGEPAFRPADLEWLLELLRIPTVNPLEGGGENRLVEAQRCFAQGAKARGLDVVSLGPAPGTVLDDDLVPVGVREAAGAGEEFLARQPNLVLRAGSCQPLERTLVFNFHMDTVGPELPVELRGGVLHGRGAVDDKGPGVALVAGVRAAVAERGEVLRRCQVLVHSVAGEEGGAMGVYGTRWLLSQGHVGRLNVFAEPTAGRYLDSSTASMTVAVEVHGDDATDDHPEQGHNATVLLGFLAQHLALTLADPVRASGARMCVAGLHTGDAHNRVYGSGRLLLNLAYASAAAAGVVAEAVEQACDGGLERFRTTFAGSPLLRRTAGDCARITSLRWLKRGLPALANRDAEFEALLSGIGLSRNEATGDGEGAFTCDAIWAALAPGYTIVYGPGSLSADGAHTARERVEVALLERYAEDVRRLVLAFDDRVAGGRPSPGWRGP